MNIQDKINTLTEDQKKMFDLLKNESLYQFRVPTGFGKGYVMMISLLDEILNSNKKVFTITSHRLSLNNQHLKDLIYDFIHLNLLDKVRFLTVGSKSLDINRLLSEDSELNNKLNNNIFNHNINQSLINRIGLKDIFKETLSTEMVTNIVNGNLNDGYKTIIITTYNSLDKLKNLSIDITYFDEAHMLATNEDVSQFKENFKLIDSKKKFFLTATPKEVQEDLLDIDIFLMNNTKVFGEIFHISFKDCVDRGYIIEPIIHISSPKVLKENDNYDSIENKCNLILESFTAHEKWLKSSSFKPDEIDAKMLVRCESVSSMWEIYNYIMSDKPSDIIICAGASRNDDNNSLHYFNDIGYNNRDEFIRKIQSVNSNEKVIILNFDIFSEGINVPGITGVMFMQKKMPSIPKIIQIIGRSTRLHTLDRLRLRNGEIEIRGENWIKPNCAAIIPYWDDTTHMTKKVLCELIKKLRDNLNFSPSLILSLGDDIGISSNNLNIDTMNNINKKSKLYQIMKDIKHEIEELDNTNSELLLNDINVDSKLKRII